MRSKKKAIISIYRNVKKLESLVEDVLDVYKLDLGKINLTKKMVIISELLSNVINDSKSIAEEKQVSMITEINIKSGNKMYCDEKRIEQVFINLIKNSIDFVPEKGGQIILMVTEEVEEGGGGGLPEKENKITNTNTKNNTFTGKNKIPSNIVFTIKDNGLGIPKDKIDNLFKKFYQIDASPTRKHAGTGLGLVICKGIVEAHGGKIWIDNSNMNGLSIKFTLPFITATNIQ